METTVDTPTTDNSTALTALHDYMATLVDDKLAYVVVAPFVEAMGIIAEACDNPLDRVAVETLLEETRRSAVGETKSYVVNDRRFMDTLLDLRMLLAAP